MKSFVCIAIAVMMGITGNSQQSRAFLFVGTYTNQQPDKGIYIFELDTLTGALSATSNGEQITNPSFLTLSANGRYLYACTDTKTLVPGSISAFAIDSIAGVIRFINKQSSAGANPVYVVTDPGNTFAVLANYTEGSVTVLPLNRDGSVSPATQAIPFHDSSINKTRQEKPHVHSVYFSPDNDYVYAPDLGSDKIRAFSFNNNNKQPLRIDEKLTVAATPGSGPRHMVFHPSKKWAYCIEEMSGMVSLYEYGKGKLKKVQTIASYQQAANEHSGADIHISPDGLFLYASNRVENTISIFSIGLKGKLTLLGHQSTMGDVPRNFCIDPTGRFLLVANQGSNNIVVFKRDAHSGLLQPAGVQVSVPAPSCLQMRVYR